MTVRTMKNADVQVGVLVLAGGAARARVKAQRPPAGSTQGRGRFRPSSDGDEQQQEERHRGGHGLERPAEHHHPLGAEGVEDHQQDQRAEGDAGPVGEGRPGTRTGGSLGSHGARPAIRRRCRPARRRTPSAAGLRLIRSALAALELSASLDFGVTEPPASTGRLRALELPAPSAAGRGRRAGSAAAPGRRPPPPSARDRQLGGVRGHQAEALGDDLVDVAGRPIGVERAARAAGAAPSGGPRCCRRRRAARGRCRR